jgi:hypothetical protein
MKYGSIFRFRKQQEQTLSYVNIIIVTIGRRVDKHTPVLGNVVGRIILTLLPLSPSKHVILAYVTIFRTHEREINRSV